MKVVSLRHFSTCLGAGLIACALALQAQAATLLDYTFNPEVLPVYVVPESAFHSQQQTDDRAATLIAGWKTEPLTIGWTRIALGCYVKHKILPTRAARGGALIHVAMHDALQWAKQENLEPSVVVSSAAAQVLGYLFTPEEKAFDRIAESVAKQEGGGSLNQSLSRALALGKAVGQRVVAYGESDGAARGWNGLNLQWYGEGRYYGPGTWEPTPPYFYYPPAEPFAPDWKPWALKFASQFRPTPPAYNSRKFLKDLQELVEINKGLTEEQTKIAKFWVDGHGSVTPPGRWNQIAIDMVLAHKADSENTAEIFAVLNVALADSFIAVWDTKYHYWTARPITTAKQVLDITLKTPILTPPFPSYVSGHAAFSGGSAEVLGHYFKEDRMKVRAMAEEAAMSRLYGGIHYRHDNEDGLELGRKVASEVIDWYASKINP